MDRRMNRVGRIMCAGFLFTVMVICGYFFADQAHALTTTQSEKIETTTMNEVRAHKAVITDGVAGISADEMKNIQRVVVYSDPVMYSEIKIGFSINKTDNTIKAMYVNYKHSASQIAASKKNYDKLTAACVNYAKKGKTTTEKVRLAHDYIIKNIAYKRSVDALGTVLTTKKGCCMGYTNYFSYVMKKLNVPCRAVIASDASHAWNQVKISGKWYHVDVTWDDLGSKASTKFFLISDSKLKSLDKRSWTGAFKCYTSMSASAIKYTTKSGLKKVGSSYVYVKTNGSYAKGWTTISGSKYHFNTKSGKASKGVVKIGSKKYGFSKTGKMYKNTKFKYNNHTYKASSKGIVTCEK